MVDTRTAPDSWLVRRYFALRRWTGYLPHSIRALHQAVWLGVLNRDQLAELTEWRYRQWSDYTDPSYNLSGFEKWEEEALDRYFGSCKSILVGAAGGGREVAALRHRGLDVGAFECSADFAKRGSEILRAAKVDIPIKAAEPDRVPGDFGTFGGFIMGWGGYMHIVGKAQRIAFLKECRQHLRLQSSVLLSFFTRSADGRTVRWTKKIANFLRWFRPGAEPVEMGDLLERTLNHRFTRDEVQKELEAAGFEMLHFADEPYGHAVGRLVGQGGA
jgi:hypothetical protein